MSLPAGLPLIPTATVGSYALPGWYQLTLEHIGRGELGETDIREAVEDASAVRAESRIQSAELYAAISSLPDDFRDALLAVDVVGLSYREAARALRVPEATITTRLYRARRRLAEALEAQA